jgi:hypothetical protein
MKRIGNRSEVEVRGQGTSLVPISAEFSHPSPAPAYN